MQDAEILASVASAFSGTMKRLCYNDGPHWGKGYGILRRHSILWLGDRAEWPKKSSTTQSNNNKQQRATTSNNKQSTANPFSGQALSAAKFCYFKLALRPPCHLGFSGVVLSLLRRLRRGYSRDAFCIPILLVSGDCFRRDPFFRLDACD